MNINIQDINTFIKNIDRDKVKFEEVNGFSHTIVIEIDNEFYKLSGSYTMWDGIDHRFSIVTKVTPKKVSKVFYESR